MVQSRCGKSPCWRQRGWHTKHRYAAPPYIEYAAPPYIGYAAPPYIGFAAPPYIGFAVANRSCFPNLSALSKMNCRGLR
jgi:hypothetical protein